MAKPAPQAKRSVAQPAPGDGGGSAAQPAVYLPLAQLTTRSARMAKLKLTVCATFEDVYTYTTTVLEKADLHTFSFFVLFGSMSEKVGKV